MFPRAFLPYLEFFRFYKRKPTKPHWMKSICYAAEKTMKLSVNSGLHHTFAAYVVIPVRIVRRTLHTNQRHTLTLSLSRTHVCCHWALFESHHILDSQQRWYAAGSNRTYDFTREDSHRDRERSHTHTYARARTRHIRKRKRGANSRGKRD